MSRKNFDQILKKIGFLVNKVIYSNDSILFAKGQYRNCDSLIKIIPLSDHRRLNSIKKEILLDKIISIGGKKDINIKIPIKFYFKENGFAVVIRDFIQGEALSTYARGSGKPLLVFYENIDQKYKSQLISIIQNVIEKVSNLQILSEKIIKSSSSDILSTPRFFFNLLDYDIKKIEGECDFSLQKQIDFYNGNFKIFHAKENLKVAMGDLVPGNIIIKKNHAEIVDFEWLSFDNYLFDFAWFWLSSS